MIENDKKESLSSKYMHELYLRFVIISSELLANDFEKIILSIILNQTDFMIKRVQTNRLIKLHIHLFNSS